MLLKKILQKGKKVIDNLSTTITKLKTKIKKNQHVI